MFIRKRVRNTQQTHIRGRLWTVLIIEAICVFPELALAHPMGNFSISHYAGITIERNQLEVRYLIDMAEIPTFQEIQQDGIAGRTDDPHLASYLATKAREFGQGLQLSINGQNLSLRPVSQQVIFPPGAGNLPTMKFGFLYRAKTPDKCMVERCELEYEDANFAGRAGWKEIMVTAAREVTMISSTAPDHDRSGQLSNYPTDLLNSPPQYLHAKIVFAGHNLKTPPPSFSAEITSGPPSSTHGRRVKEEGKNKVEAAIVHSNAAAPDTSAPQIEIKPNQESTPRNAFTEIMGTRSIGVGVALLAALIAAGLGALHALEPGHGKTVVAAYLVGARGTARDAFVLGSIVTISHTAGVYVLGAVTLYAQKYILPEKLYPLMGVLSGIFIAGMGFYLLLQRYAGTEPPHSHNHGPNGHHHGGLFHSHSHTDGHMHEELPAMQQRSSGSDNRGSAHQLLILGITGGMVPCPAALVVLLSALALHRVAFGFFLIVAFSIGLAAVLIGMGLVAVYAGHLLSRSRTESPLVQRWLPLSSAVLITVLGWVIALRGLIAAGIVQIRV
jgi:ABC-type nickel/cobalt efflux system permease component RcnA